MKRSNRRWMVIGMMSVALLVGACATEGGGAAPANRAVAVDTTPPAGSALAKVSAGMTDIDVRKAMGEPDSSNSYQTGKAWIPFYYGPDTARADWIYTGQGRVVFSRNRYSGGLKVVRVIYDPSEGR